MMKFKLYEAWLDESSAWRNTSEEFLYNLLKDGHIQSRGKEFVSMCLDENSGGQDDYGDVRIQFSLEEILNQGGIICDYEDLDFWESYPEITKHVTGYESEREYYESLGFDNAQECYESNELTWDMFINSYKDEEEIVIKKIILKPGLILSVSSKKPLSSKTVNLLNKNNIKIK